MLSEQNMFREMLCAQKTFQPLGRGENYCQHFVSISNVRNFTFEDNQTPSSWCVTKRLTILRKRRKSIKRMLKMCIAQNLKATSLFTFQRIKTLTKTTTAESAKPVVTCLTFYLRNKNWHWLHPVEMVQIALAERRLVTAKSKKHPLLQKNLRQSQTTTPESELLEQKWFRLWHNIVAILLVAATNQNSFRVSFSTVSIYIWAVWFSQFPKKETSCLSTLDEILFFWL